MAKEERTDAYLAPLATFLTPRIDEMYTTLGMVWSTVTA